MTSKESTIELDEQDIQVKSSKKKWIYGIVAVVLIVAVALLVAHFGFDAFSSGSKAEESTSGPWPKLMERTYGDIYGEGIKAGPNAAAELQDECKAFLTELEELYVGFTTSKDAATVESFLYPYNDYQVCVSC